MLKISIPGVECYDESTGLFIEAKPQILQLEHSLVSISKWESKWKKPFLGKEPKTREETLDYIRCMTITQNVDSLVYNVIPASVIEEINAYLEAPMTATWFNDRHAPKGSGEVITNEIIYYWMVSLQIPFDPCEKWHLNRLLTLVRVCNAKNAPAKKMSKRDIMNQNRALNAARRQKLNSHG